MVERIVVNPQEVRGLGNVVNDEKTKQDVDVFNSYVTAESDLIDGIRIGIMRMTYNDPNLLFSFNRLEKFLYVNSDEASLGWSSKKLTLDSDDLIIGFDTDNKTLYVGTDAPPVVHDYSISFSQDSYTAVDGSAEVSCTLLDNGVAVSGATVTFTGGTSTVTGTTGSNGVATVTVTFNATGTVTATYESVSDTATVTVGPSYLFYDECTSSSGLSNYGQIRPISPSTTTSYLEYDSTNSAYYVHADGDWGVIPITALNGVDNYKITAEVKTKASGNTYQGGIGFIAETGTSNVIFRKYGTTCNSVVNDSSQQNIGTIRSANSYWHKFEITKQGKNFSVTVTDVDNDTVIGTLSRTISFDTYYVGFMTVAGQNYGSYVRNVKAEAL